VADKVASKPLLMEQQGGQFFFFAAKIDREK
jgi:hypothetical protein